MRIMAFDYGTKRVGVAVTDPEQIIATALTTKHPDELFNFLKLYLQQESVSTFLVGLPVQTDGTPSQSAQHIVGFIRRLNKYYPEIPVETLDERYTSKMAIAAIAQSGMSRKSKRDKGRVDRMSAVILLQDYMDRRSKMR